MEGEPVPRNSREKPGNCIACLKFVGRIYLRRLWFAWLVFSSLFGYRGDGLSLSEGDVKMGVNGIWSWKGMA